MLKIGELKTIITNIQIVTNFLRKKISQNIFMHLFVYFKRDATNTEPEIYNATKIIFKFIFVCVLIE